MAAMVTTDAVLALIAHLDSQAASASGRRRLAGWTARQPELAAWSTPAELAAAIRSAGGAEQDRLVASVVSVADGDELAQLTVLAGLAGRLMSVVGGWRRAGVAPELLQEMAVDLVSSTWIATADLARRVSDGQPVPGPVAWHVVDEAREMVRVPRRRDRRRAARAVPLAELTNTPAARPVRTTADRLAVVIAGAVQSGRLTRRAAAPVFMTRVAGFPVSETATWLGWSESTVRAVRWRAERRLIAA